jgi:propanol-preferring alcohol dehydrogenase
MLLETPGPADRAPLRASEILDPPLRRGELVVRVTACGVCRTDLQLAEGDIAMHASPVVPGHQAVGRVEAVGSGVTGWRVGDRVGVAWLASACRHCAQCKAGRENLCEDAKFTGWDRDGGFATKLAVRADFALPLPPSFTDLEAAPLLCGGIIGYRALKRSGVQPGQRLGLYGFGASALIAIQVARHWGCRVFVVTRSREEQVRAEALGAEWVGDYSERPPEPLDAAVTFAPAGSVVRAALQALDRGATVAINAIHLDGIPPIPYEELWWERSLSSVANFTRQDAHELLELAARIPIRTHVDVFPLDAANVALDRLKKGQINGAAVLAIDTK